MNADNNTSGQGASASVPAEIDRWNWGAFLLNWIWGIGNNTFIAFLMFVPFVNLPMAFILGAKGSAWAWRNKRWASVEEFKKVQRRWALAGLAVLVGTVLLFVAIAMAAIAAMRNSEAYQMAFTQVQGHPQAVELIGTPMTAGLPSGAVSVSGPTGEASLSFDVEGPKGKGTVHVEAVKAMGQWKIEQMVLEDGGSDRRLELVP